MQEFPGCHVVGIAADVSQAAAVDRLVAQAAEELGQIVSLLWAAVGWSADRDGRM